ncbi:predicted protein [Plenodomus lingam JN3]|uniref:Predicted protein n=1 Tax=Leptosphaeria maculans (strain JN3 / isolate v23.1.3 / race Av1-4-5-6-7-8) TaxID=985895 RepID=E4ZPK5_LEPMJ|nr:predicted protein [Plenodomus lingam JN3]CBX93230.1 predicted protein [Plenodomus lingam JN3]
MLAAINPTQHLESRRRPVNPSLQRDEHGGLRHFGNRRLGSSARARFRVLRTYAKEGQEGKSFNSHRLCFFAVQNSPRPRTGFKWPRAVRRATFPFCALCSRPQDNGEMG